MCDTVCVTLCVCVCVCVCVWVHNHWQFVYLLLLWIPWPLGAGDTFTAALIVGLGNGLAVGDDASVEGTWHYYLPVVQL